VTKFVACYSAALRRTDAPESELLQYAAAPRWFGEQPGVSHARLAEWLGTRQQRRLAANKVVHRDEGGNIHVRLHATDVVTAHADGSHTVRTGGWHTPTTRRTIAYLTGLPVRSDGRGGSLIGGHPLREGMRVPHDLPSDRPAVTAVTTPPDHPDLGALFVATVGSRGQDDTAGRALADWLQDRGDWRHHLFANPLPEDGHAGDFSDATVVPHGQPLSNSRVRFRPTGAVVATSIGDHGGEHLALLGRDQYEQMRAEAATADVHFPEYHRD
jgi:hypothetical protein